MQLITSSSEETKKAAEKLLKQLKGKRVLALYGDLGSGKTTFVQGWGEALGIKQRIISPTFILVRSYPISGGKEFHHVDLYRLEKEEELETLGSEEILADTKAIVAIEWAEKLGKHLPPETVKIKFENLGGNKRKITVTP